MRANLHHLRVFCILSTMAIAFTANTPSAFAQENSFKSTCQPVGAGSPEPLADREGHSISVLQTSCRIDSGPMAGGFLTGVDIYEWDKTNAILLTANGAIRKPGSTVVLQIMEGKIALAIVGGRVTGVTVSGKGRNLLATGDATSLAGKSFTYTGKSTESGQIVVETKIEY